MINLKIVPSIGTSNHNGLVQQVSLGHSERNEHLPEKRVTGAKIFTLVTYIEERKKKTWLNEYVSNEAMHKGQKTYESVVLFSPPEVVVQNISCW